MLRVTDANSLGGEADITLIEPLSLRLSANAYQYPNGYNISLWNAYNGSIAVTVAEGVAPYIYIWDDGPTTKDRPGLGNGTYAVMVTDANSCKVRSEKVYITQPERSDWTMTGNAGTDPSVHSFGTTDAKDVVFKTNGAELLRLQSTAATPMWSIRT